jgi:hypothetical protein
MSRRATVPARAADAGTANAADYRQRRTHARDFQLAA